jgi:hypothetical protein
MAGALIAAAPLRVSPDLDAGREVWEFCDFDALALIKTIFRDLHA